MTDKLTDEQIIKALECCEFEGNCTDCPKFTGQGCMGVMDEVLDLINRQKAEIEQWKEEANKYQSLWCEAVNDIQTAKSEAIKATILEIDYRLSHYGKCDELHKYEVSDVLVEVEEAMVGE